MDMPVGIGNLELGIGSRELREYGRRFLEWELFIFDLCACIFNLPSNLNQKKGGRRLGEWQIGLDGIRHILGDSFAGLWVILRKIEQ